MFVPRKDGEREQARELRRAGWSLLAIARELGVAKSSVSLWVRDLPRPNPVPRRAPRARPLSLSGDVKRCGRCRRNLPVEFFNRHPKTGRQHWCRECFASYFKRRGNLHRAQVRANDRRRIAAARRHVLAHLDENPCVDCSESHLVVLDFDHVLGAKVKTVGALAGEGASIRRIDDEIEKCDVVCANCHRRRTYTRARSWRVEWPATRLAHLDAPVLANLEFVRGYLHEQGCVDCGIEELALLEFDHVGEKRIDVMRAVWNGCGRARILEEISLCQVRCANCHRLRTAERSCNYRYLAVFSDSLTVDGDALPA